MLANRHLNRKNRQKCVCSCDPVLADHISKRRKAARPTTGGSFCSVNLSVAIRAHVNACIPHAYTFVIRAHVNACVPRACTFVMSVCVNGWITHARTEKGASVEEPNNQKCILCNV